MAAMVRNSIQHPNHPTVHFACLLLLALTKDAHAVCNLPSALQGTWFKVDNDRDITMTGTGTSGQDVVAGSGTYTDGFDCFTVSGNTYVFGTSTSVANPIGGQSNGYFCWDLVYQTASTYLLYQRTGTATSGTFNGYKVLDVPEGDASPSVSDVCTLSASAVTPTLLFKKNGGSLAAVSTAQRQCSPEVFATYTYVKDGSGCSGSDSKLDFCQDRMTARVDYSACATKILFSQNGLLSCLATFSSGSSTYQLLYNQDSSVDNSNYYTFVCMDITNSGGSEVATVRPKDCAVSSGSHELILTRTVSCPITDGGGGDGGGGDGGGGDEVDDSGSGSDLMPVIIGAAAGAVVIIAIVIGAIVLYKLVFSKRMKKVSPDKPVANGTSPPVDLEEKSGALPSESGESIPDAQAAVVNGAPSSVGIA